MVAITEVINLENKDDIAIITTDNPPVNALGIAVRQGLVESITQAEADDSAKAIVIICRGRTFFAGADIKEFGQPLKEPGFGKVLETIESCSKPIIAAIHGTAFGGGLEIALACHFRIAVTSALFGLPEVKLGLLPGAGGTQRLPRIVGVEKALKMITSGDPISVQDASQDQLIDEIVDDNLAEEALFFARKVIAENRPLRIISRIDEKIESARKNPEIFNNFRKSIAGKTRGFEAPEACIQAVEAAVNLPFAEGLKFEWEQFLKLVSGSQSAAQRYYFFSERQVAKLPDIPKDTPQLQISKAAVIGAGTMGGGITMNFVNVGIPVTLVEENQKFLERGLSVIRKNFEITAAKGKLTLDELEKRMSMIFGTTNLEDVAEADITIEAIYENMDLKKEIFSKLNRICKKDAIMATNTSYLNVNEIAAMTDRPENVLGLHFFSPANVMKLLEIVRGDKTSKTVLATSMSLAKRIKKIAVVVGVCYGFAGNRMFAQRGREVQKLLLEGATIAQLDRVIYDFGFPMGPFILSDLIGTDIGWDKKTSTGSTIRERLCEMGRLGLKAGRGYYKYKPDSRVPIPDPEVDKLVEEFSEKNQIKRSEIPDQEIIQRCIYSIINEGAKILEEGIAVRPNDLDVIWINGYGWPVYLGGPMFYADLIGLDKILDTIKKFEQQQGEVWKPAALLEKLVSQGKGFKDLA